MVENITIDLTPHSIGIQDAITPGTFQFMQQTRGVDCRIESSRTTVHSARTRESSGGLEHLASIV